MPSSIDQKDISLLDKTIDTREKILDSLLKREKALEDTKNINLLLRVMDSLDLTIVQKTKVKIEDRSANDQSEVKEAMKEFMMELHKNKNNSKNIPQDREVELPQDIKYDLKEGETEEHAEPMTLNSFLSRYKKHE